MPATTNISAGTARLVDYGTTTQDVSGAAGPDFAVWFKYVAKAGEVVISVRATASLASNYDPSIDHIYVGPSSSLTAHPYATFTQVGKPVEVPMVPGTEYFFKVIQNSSGVTPNEDLTFIVAAAPGGTIPAGSIIVNDDIVGFPAGFVDPATGTILGYKNVPAGESGEILPDGTMLIQDKSDNTVKLYDSAFNFIATIAGVTLTDTGNIGSNRLDTFYTGSLGTGFLSSSVSVISEAGTVIRTFTLTGFSSLKGLAANVGDTILYVSSGAVGGAVRRWDLVNDVFLSDLVPTIANSLFKKDLLRLDDGSVLVPVFSTIAPHAQSVKRYDASGALLNTYAMPDGDTAAIDHITYGSDDSTFIVWLQTADENIFKTIRVSDGAELSSVTNPQNAIGVQIGARTDVMAMFGIENSCFMGTTPTTISVPPTPTTGTPIPPDGTNPCCAEPNPNPPPPSGTPPPGNPGNAPPPNPYVPLPPWVASCDGGGTVPQAADETDPESWWAA